MKYGICFVKVKGRLGRWLDFNYSIGLNELFYQQSMVHLLFTLLDRRKQQPYFSSKGSNSEYRKNINCKAVVFLYTVDDKITYIYTGRYKNRTRIKFRVTLSPSL